MRYYCEDCRRFCGSDEVLWAYENPDGEGGYHILTCPTCKSVALVYADVCPLCRGDKVEGKSICSDCMESIDEDLVDLIDGYIKKTTRHSPAGYTTVRDIILERIEEGWFK